MFIFCAVITMWKVATTVSTGEGFPQIFTHDEKFSPAPGPALLCGQSFEHYNIEKQLVIFPGRGRTRKSSLLLLLHFVFSCQLFYRVNIPEIAKLLL